MAAPALDLWMNGEHVGTWRHDRAGVGVLRYADSWLRSPQARPLTGMHASPLTPPSPHSTAQGGDRAPSAA